MFETGAARGNKIQASRDFSQVPPREQWLRAAGSGQRAAGPPEMLRFSLRGVAQHFDVGGYVNPLVGHGRGEAGE